MTQTPTQTLAGDTNPHRPAANHVTFLNLYIDGNTQVKAIHKKIDTVYKKSYVKLNVKQLQFSFNK